MLVPLAIINHFKPTRPLEEQRQPRRTLPARASTNATWRWRPTRSGFTWRNFFLWLDRLHKFAEWFARARHSSVPQTRAEERPSNGCWNGLRARDGLAAIFPAMLNSLIALKALGYPDDHPQVVRAERELKKLEHETEDSVRIEPCFSPVWDTAIVAICLRESGVPADHPALKQRRRMADGQGNPVSRRLAIQESGQGRAERLGV